MPQYLAVRVDTVTQHTLEKENVKRWVPFLCPGCYIIWKKDSLTSKLGLTNKAVSVLSIGYRLWIMLYSLQ